MGSVRLLGKSVPILAIAIAVLASAGVVSAVLLSYYGTAETTADILQSVKLNDKAWDEQTVIEPVDVVAGNTWTSTQTLTNAASVNVLVKLETEITCESEDTGGVTVTYLVWDAVEGEWGAPVEDPELEVPASSEGVPGSLQFIIVLTTDPRVVPETYTITTTILTVEPE